MTILGILQTQLASKDDVEAFEKNETPISIVDLYKDKLQLADIFFMDNKYKDFFSNCDDIRYNFSDPLGILSSSEDTFSYIKNFENFEDINEYISKNNSFIFEKMDGYSKKDIRYYYINLHIEFEEKKYIISAKYSIDREGNRKLIDLLNITEVYFNRRSLNMPPLGDKKEVEE